MRRRTTCDMKSINNLCEVKVKLPFTYCNENFF